MVLGTGLIAIFGYLIAQGGFSIWRNYKKKQPLPCVIRPYIIRVRWQGYNIIKPEQVFKLGSYSFNAETQSFGKEDSNLQIINNDSFMIFDMSSLPRNINRLNELQLQKIPITAYSFVYNQSFVIKKWIVTYKCIKFDPNTKSEHFLTTKEDHFVLTKDHFILNKEEHQEVFLQNTSELLTCSQDIWNL